MRRRLIRTLAFICALFAAAALADEPELVVYFEHNPPFQMVGEQGAGYGPLLDFTRSLLEEADIDGNFVAQPWARILSKSAERRNALILSIARTPEREADFNWLTEIYRGSSFVWKVRGKPDPENVFFGVERGSHKMEHLSEVVGRDHVVEFLDSEQALANLLKGHVQRYVGLSFAVAGKMAELQQPMERLERMEVFNEPGQGNTRMYLALTLGTDRNLEMRLRDALNVPHIKLELDAIRRHFIETERSL